MKESSLPEPIALYFRADKEDGPAVARCFTKEAVVMDEGQTYAGRAAIDAWKTAASDQFAYSTEPLTICEQGHRLIVTARVSGNFPGAPVDLQYIFTLQGDLISSLEVTL